MSNALWRSFALGVFSAYCRAIVFLCRVGVPAGLVNLTRLFVPDVLMRAGARVYQDEQQERECRHAYDYWQARQQAGKN
jgi:hypothetical protein